MKKKTIVFSCFAILFLLSAFSGFLGGLVSGGIGCLAICCIFTFLAFRSAKSASTTTHSYAEKAKSDFSPSMQSINTQASQMTAKNDIFTSEPDTSTKPDITPAAKDNYEYISLKVAGVTFKNPKGISRQTILRKIHFNDEPFNEFVELCLKQYEFEGAPAFAVYANDMQIGNIPADYVQLVIDNDERYEGISGINVYGGGRNEDGYTISYGCEITLKYRNLNI